MPRLSSLVGPGQFQSDFRNPEVLGGRRLLSPAQRRQEVVTGLARQNLEAEGLGSIANSPLFEQVVGQGNRVDQPLLGGQLIQARREHEINKPLHDPTRDSGALQSQILAMGNPGFDKLFGALELAQLRQAGTGKGLIGQDRPRFQVPTIIGRPNTREVELAELLPQQQQGQ